MNDVDRIIGGLRKQLQDRNLMEVSRRTGISWGTLHGIRSGKRKDMHLTTWQTLVRYLDGNGPVGRG